MEMNVGNEKESLKEILELTVQDPSVYKEDKAKIIIQATSLLCGIIAAQPIPFADIFVLTPIQLIMVTYLNKIKGNPYKKAEMSEILASLLGVVGWGALAQHVILGLYKTVLPFLGAVTTIPLVYAATYALGKCAEAMIEAKSKDQKISDEELKKLADETKRMAKSERKNMGLAEAAKLLGDIKRNSKEYKKYRTLIEENDLYNLLQKIEINTDSRENIDINEKIGNKMADIKHRINEKYPQVLCTQSVLFTLSLLPTKVWVEEAEPFIAQVYHDISKSNCILEKRLGNTLFMNADTTFGKVTLLVNKTTLIQKVDLNDKYKSEFIWKYIAEVKYEENLFDIDIKKRFHEMIKASHDEICVISPWVNKGVSKTVIPLLKEASQRGVKIKIIYGISDNTSNPSEQKRRTDSDEAIQEYIEALGDSLTVKRDNTHVKLCTCDNSYLLGSYNFLSFNGNYDLDDLRKEFSVYGEDEQKVQDLKEQYFKNM